ncbi:MAG: WD40 repeat domain-containing protein [Planctomycetes bacterium]|nr:WD40 repeat domain-containing protein [Planctomycetota bacterium]
MRLAFSRDTAYAYAGYSDVCALRLADGHISRRPAPRVGSQAYFAVAATGHLILAENLNTEMVEIICMPPGGQGEPLWVRPTVGYVYTEPLFLTDTNRFLLLEWVANGEPIVRQRLGATVETYRGWYRIVSRDLNNGDHVAESPDLRLPPFNWKWALSPCARFLAHTHRDSIYVRSTDAPFPEIALARNVSGRHFTALAFHPSGRFLAATSNDETVKLYDTTTWAVARTFTWDIGRMRSVAFSPDGTLAAAGSDKGKVVVWDVDV